MTPADASAAALADAVRIAERVREACAQAFLDAYEEAGLVGLCADGRLEAAIGAVRTLDLAAVVAALDATTKGDGQGSSR